MSRDLLDLGPDPAGYIIYPGGNSFYIDPVVEDRLNETETEADPDDLEDIFWPFVHPEIRKVLEPFRSRQNRHRASRRKEKPDTSIDTQHHIFDKRRMHYLKFGQMDQRDIGRLPISFFRVLRNKSRDEIEQKLIRMETVLSPREYKTYTYVVFNLQQFFYESYAKNTPQSLSTEKVDAHFIDQVCRLNADGSFWAGTKTGDCLHTYLVRYVIMYFDHDFATRSFMEEYIRRFISSHRAHRTPFASSTLTLKKASIAFGKSQDVLQKMNRKEFARLFRLKAQQLHPDKGGDHDDFVKLTDAYHALMKTKK